MTANQAPPGNPAVPLATLLAGLGIKESSVRDELETIVTSELSNLGLEATIGGFRHDVLTLVTDPLNAALLRYDIDRLRTAVSTRFTLPIQSITVKTRRGPQ